MSELSNHLEATIVPSDRFADATGAVAVPLGGVMYPLVSQATYQADREKSDAAMEAARRAPQSEIPHASGRAAAGAAGAADWLWPPGIGISACRNESPLHSGKVELSNHLEATFVRADRLADVTGAVAVPLGGVMAPLVSLAAYRADREKWGASVEAAKRAPQSEIPHALGRAAAGAAGAADRLWPPGSGISSCRNESSLRSDKEAEGALPRSLNFGFPDCLPRSLSSTRAVSSSSSISGADLTQLSARGLALAAIPT